MVPSKLKMDSNHRRFRFIKKIRHPQYILTTLGLTVGVSLFSGSDLYRPEKEESFVESTEEVSSQEENQVVFQDIAMERSVRNELGYSSGEPVTLNDLKQLTNLVLMEVNQDVSLVNDCTNLESLLFFHCSCDFSTLNELPSLRKLSLWSVDLDFDFLKQYPQLEELSLWNVDVENLDFLTFYPNLKKLTLSDCDYLKKLPMDKLKTLDVLSFEHNVDRTSMLRYLTYQNICDLEEAGVSIETELPLSDLKKLALQLDQIASGLGVSANHSEQEKLDAVLIYVLEHLTYDPEVFKGTDQEVLQKIKEYNFNTLGYALDDNPNAICCNYASLVEALSMRLGLEMYSLKTPSHAWNLVQIDGDYYHVDATWLDSSLEKLMTKGENLSASVSKSPIPPIDEMPMVSGKKDATDWYMVPLGEAKVADSSNVHDESVLPLFLTYRVVDDDKAEVNFNGKTLLISFGALFGLFVATKIAIPIVKTIIEKRKRGKQQDKLWDLVVDYERFSSRSPFKKK